MIDLALIFEGDEVDLAVGPGDIQTEDSLRTAVIVSLFTDRQSEEDDLPIGQDRRGWWADLLLQRRHGSRLWLLLREKQRPEAIAKAEEYAREALQWLIDEKIASRVEVTASFNRTSSIRIVIGIYRASEATQKFQFDFAWK